MKSVASIIFGKNERVCPPWLCFTFDNAIRKLIQNPHKILSPYLEVGYTAIDIGPGKGYFSIPLCSLVGKKGKVIAVDIQEKMLSALRERASKLGKYDNLITHLSEPNDFNLAEKADFILAFWMVHEVPNKAIFFNNVKGIMRSNAKMLIAEPFFHVWRKAFEEMVRIATDHGFKVMKRPKIALSYSVLLAVD